MHVLPRPVAFNTPDFNSLCLYAFPFFSLQAKKSRPSFVLAKAVGGSHTVTAAPTRGEKWDEGAEAAKEVRLLKAALARDGLTIERLV